MQDSNRKRKHHKVLGAGLGWALGGPVGAAIGMLVGHAIETQFADMGADPGQANMLRAHFDTLQISYDAGPEQIRAAYKQMACRYHPDRFVDSSQTVQELVQEKMAKINEAYCALMAAEKNAGSDI